LAIGYCELKSAKYLTKWCTLTFYKVYYRFTVSSRIKELEKLGAGQSPMLARQAVPLATAVTKINSVDKTNKTDCHCNILSDRKTNFRLIIYSHSCLQCFDAVGWAAGTASGL